jgi:hypothetical protein
MTAFVVVFVVEAMAEVVDEDEAGSEILDDLRGGYR